MFFCRILGGFPRYVMHGSNRLIPWCGEARPQEVLQIIKISIWFDRRTYKTYKKYIYMYLYLHIFIDTGTCSYISLWFDESVSFPKNPNVFIFSHLFVSIIMYWPGDSKCPFHPLVGGHLTFPKGHFESPGDNFFHPLYFRLEKTTGPTTINSQAVKVSTEALLQLFQSPEGWTLAEAGKGCRKGCLKASRVPGLTWGKGWPWGCLGLI